MPATETPSQTGSATRQTQPVLDLDTVIQIPPAQAKALLGHQGTVQVAVRLVGPESAPVIIALGGISANRHVADRILPQTELNAGWWQGVAGADRALDTSRFRVLSFDFFPDDPTAQTLTEAVSPETQAKLAEWLCNAFDIQKLHAFVGASYGGMVGLSFAQQFPHRLERVIVACASHRPHPLGAAWRSIQRKIVKMGLATNQPDQALSLARELGMTTYRTAEEFGCRFANGQAALGYLEHRGQDFLKKMSPQRYLHLSQSIDLHAVEPAAITSPVTLIAFRQDQLVPIEDVRMLRDQLPNVAAYYEADSIYGHDAFLKEIDQVSNALTRALQ